MKCNKLLLVLSGFFSFSLVGCATVIDTPHQVVTVTTPHAPDATCELSNSRGTWQVQHTPNTVKIRRDEEQLNVVCRKANYYDASKLITPVSNVDNLGNLIIGGVIGMAVDYGTSATYEYPSVISIPMMKKNYY